MQMMECDDISEKPLKGIHKMGSLAPLLDCSIMTAKLFCGMEQTTPHELTVAGLCSDVAVCQMN